MPNIASKKKSLRKTIKANAANRAMKAKILTASRKIEAALADVE